MEGCAKVLFGSLFSCPLRQNTVLRMWFSMAPVRHGRTLVEAVADKLEIIASTPLQFSVYAEKMDRSHEGGWERLELSFFAGAPAAMIIPRQLLTLRENQALWVLLYNGRHCFADVGSTPVSVHWHGFAHDAVLDECFDRRALLQRFVLTALLDPLFASDGALYLSTKTFLDDALRTLQGKIGTGEHGPVLARLRALLPRPMYRALQKIVKQSEQELLAFAAENAPGTHGEDPFAQSIMQSATGFDI